MVKSSGPEVFCEKGVVKIFAKFSRNYLWQSLFLNNFMKKKTLRHRCFPVNFAKFLRTAISQNITERLLLEIWG